MGLQLAIISYLIFGESDTWFTSLGSYLYFILLPTFWAGYTVGKRILGIRGVKLDETDVNLWTIIKRQLIAYIIYTLTLGTGVIVNAFMVGIREDKRAIHDFIAGTYVSFYPPWQKQFLRTSIHQDACSFSKYIL